MDSDQLTPSKKITFIIVTIIISWIIIEGLFQVLCIIHYTDRPNLTDIFKNPAFIPHNYLIAVPNPNYDGSYTDNYGRRIIIRHNNIGMRGKDVRFTKESGVVRIVSMGGSTTYCWTCSDGSTWSDIVEKELSLNYPLKKFEVLNAGVSGYNSFPILIYFASKISYLEPDYIVLYVTANDIIRLQQRDFDGDYSGRHNLVQRKGSDENIYYFLWKYFTTVRIVYRVALYMENIIKGFLSKVTNDDYNSHNLVPVEKVKKNSRYFMRNINNLYSMARCQGTKVVLAVEASPYPFVKNNSEIWEEIFKMKANPYTFSKKENLAEIYEYYYDKLREFAANHPDVIFVDTDKIIEQQINDGRINLMAKDPYDENGFFIDWIHFGITGSKIIGENVAGAILTDLRKSAGSDSQ